MKQFQALAIINNAISARLTHQLLLKDQVPLNDVAVVTIRDVQADWLRQCGVVVSYGGKPVHTLLGQIRFHRFFREGAALIKAAWASPLLREVYVVNNDNLLTNPLFVWVSDTSRKPQPRLTVVAEGIMNYQEIGAGNRAQWRWKIKPLVSRYLGLPYRFPDAHLSGSYDHGVSRVASFTSLGLKAPPEKVAIVPYGQAGMKLAPSRDVCLILHTGLWQWMSDEKYEPLGRAFSAWIAAQGFGKVLAKPHPRVDAGQLKHWLPPHEDYCDARSVEELAGEIPGATIVGMCCTALATLKMMRPDLRCVDFGADFYCQHAYGGDTSVIDFLSGSGVELVPSGILSSS